MKLKKGQEIKKAKAKRKWRFSEKVVFSVLAFSVAVFITAIIFAFITRSETIWAYLLPSVGALASSSFAVFVWKEKNENVPKILNNPNYDTEQFKQQMEEQAKQEMAMEYSNLGNNNTYGGFY